MNLFQKLSLPTDFLNADPSSWKANQTFLSAKERLMALQVINGHAQRAISLIQQFNKVLTNNEEQLQFLLEVVAEYRRTIPDSRKAVMARTPII